MCDRFALPGERGQLVEFYQNYYVIKEESIIIWLQDFCV